MNKKLRTLGIIIIIGLSTTSHATEEDVDIQAVAKKVNDKILLSKEEEVIAELKTLISAGYTSYKFALAEALIKTGGDKKEIAGLLYDAANDPNSPDEDAENLLNEKELRLSTKPREEAIAKYIED